MPDDDFAEADAPRRAAAQIHMVRAGIVVVLFLVSLILLLGPAGNYSAGAPSTTPTTHPPAHVVRHNTTVLVANGTIATGAAASFKHNLGVQGWDVLASVNLTPAPRAATQHTVTYVYFHPHQQPAAQLVAAAIGVPHTHVFLRTRAMLNAVPSSGNVDVVVILGTDLAH